MMYITLKQLNEVIEWGWAWIKVLVVGILLIFLVYSIYCFLVEIFRGIFHGK